MIVQIRKVQLPGPYVITGSRDKSIKLWDVSTSQCLFTLVRMTGLIYALPYALCSQWTTFLHLVLLHMLAHYLA